MATNHTENLNLNLWEPEDKFLREEFNENSEKLDAALGQLLSEHFYFGSFMGDGGKEPRTIELPFTPRILLISGHTTVGQHIYGAFSMVFDSHCHLFESTTHYPDQGVVRIVENGFQLLGWHQNGEDKEQVFMAIR